MKLSITILLVFVLASPLLLSNCAPEDDEDPCAKCDAAIEHMWSKLEQNSCNPQFMENAVNKIKEDCGSEVALVHAYFMAESCCNQDFKKARCFGGNELWTTVNIENSSDQLDDTVKVKYFMHQFGGGSDSTSLPPGGSKQLALSAVTDGSEFKVTVYQINTNIVLHEETQNLTYIRPGKACIERSVNIRQTGGSTYAIDFVNW